jgi:HAD superfamily hydrolase (TIGR01509 family)
MIRALLFDMDGVIIDTHASVVSYWNALAARHGFMITEAQYEQQVYGVPAVQTYESLFPMIARADYPALVAEIAEYERQLAYRPIAGALELLRALSAADVATALVTSANMAKVRVVFEQLGLDGLFTTLITADDIARGKPDPACYLAAAARLGVSAAETLVFEDAVSGARAAQRAGAGCVGVHTGRGAELLAEIGVSPVIPDLSSAGLAVDGLSLTNRLGDSHLVPLQRSTTAR